MKNIRRRDELLREAESQQSNRELLKAAATKFAAANKKLWDAYNEMRDIAYDLRSIESDMSRENDHDGVAALKKDKIDYDSLDGNYLYLLKEARRREPSTENVLALKAAETQKKHGIPKELLATGFDNEEDFNSIISIAKSKSKEGIKYIAQMPHYGVGMGKTPNIGGWTSGGPNRHIESALSYLRRCVYDLDKDKMASLNKALAPFGFVIHSVHNEKDWKSIHIELS